MFEFVSIQHYHSSLKEGRTSCLQAVEYYLQQIQATQRLNAFIHVYADEALEKARQLDTSRKAGNPTGKLHGVIIGIKDVIAFKDHPLSASSNILKGFTSIYSATAVGKLLAEEAIIIGNLNCDEFAMGSTNENSAYGKVLNALDETRIPGGSSGGSAVAVQAGLCMISLGSDTGGSVRQPADFCGVIGLKPTYGRISRYGLIAYASSFDQIGIFGNNIPDVALALEIMAGEDEYDSTVSHKPVEGYSSLLQDDKKYRIAYFNEALDHPSLDPEISSSIKSLLEQLKNGGHQVEPVSFDLLDHIVPAYYVLTTAEASSNLSRYDGVKYGYRTNKIDVDLTELYKESRSHGFGKEVKRRIMLGTFVLSAGYYDAYFTRAQKVRKLLFDKTQLIFNDFDFIFLPTAPSVAFKIGEKMDDPIAMYLADIYTVMANLVGIPAISLPLFTHSNGMPFGVQAMSNRFNELALLRISNQIMQ
ncbi:MAG TPA: Asp-tRNA(Asn)/Glu-tRNA(Gln) amidotransferase subunit GatA [Chitinophagaceae bacterium]|nr:Asp-tRNA(Asn)/Glu-tRNA(Gln) amidotransferase subunit GatA [Chitinophagaceae bacterium]